MTRLDHDGDGDAADERLQAHSVAPPLAELDWDNGRPIAIVVSRFNATLTDAMLTVCRERLLGLGVPPERIRIVSVPGSLELPIAAAKLIDTHRPYSVILLGVVLQGETDHHRHVAAGVTTAAAKLMLDTSTPITFGVLTVSTLEQALERIDQAAQYAEAAYEMAHLHSYH